MDDKKPYLKYPLNIPNKVRYWKYTSEAVYKACKTKHETAKSRAKAEARDMVFRVHGKLMDRYQMIEHIIMMTYEGLDLPKILGDTDESSVMPTAQEVTKWLDLHKNFKDELKAAEEYRAQILASNALDTILSLGENEEEPTKNQIAYAKLVKESMLEQASFISDKFQAKTRQQIEDVTEKLNPDETRMRIKAMLEANPGLLKLADSHSIGTISDNHDIIEVPDEPANGEEDGL